MRHTLYTNFHCFLVSKFNSFHGIIYKYYLKKKRISVFFLFVCYSLVFYLFSPEVVDPVPKGHNSQRLVACFPNPAGQTLLHSLIEFSSTAATATTGHSADSMHVCALLFKYFESTQLVHWLARVSQVAHGDSHYSQILSKGNVPFFFFF